MGSLCGPWESVYIQQLICLRILRWLSLWFVSLCCGGCCSTCSTEQALCLRHEVFEIDPLGLHLLGSQGKADRVMEPWRAVPSLYTSGSRVNKPEIFQPLLTDNSWVILELWASRELDQPQRSTWPTVRSLLPTIIRMSRCSWTIHKWAGATQGHPEQTLSRASRSGAAPQDSFSSHWAERRKKSVLQRFLESLQLQMCPACPEGPLAQRSSGEEPAGRKQQATSFREGSAS